MAIQVLTRHAIHLALETVLLSGRSNFKAGFNSLCAFATVNHLHWHLFYLQENSLRCQSDLIYYCSSRNPILICRLGNRSRSIPFAIDIREKQ